MPEFRIGRHKGMFCVEYYEGGKRHRRTLGTNDLDSAKAGLAEYQRQYAIHTGSGPLTVAAIYQAYVTDRAGEGKSTTRMHDAWKRLAPHFGALLPGHINKAVCRNYMDARRRGTDGFRPVGDGTLHLELGYLRAALRHAEKEKWVDRAPYVPLPQKPSPREHHLSREEARRLTDAAVMPHVRLFITLALATGARASALLQLTWDRVNFEKRRLDLRAPDRKETSKGRSVVPINDTALASLKEARKGATTNFVIEWGGKPVASVKKGVRLSGERAGVTVTPHVLRHTAAVWMAEAGNSMSEIAQYLGHRDSRTTERIYARFSPDHLRKAADALNF